MPTANNPLTGEQFIKEAASDMKMMDDYSVISKWMMRLAGIFNHNIQEAAEMSYQHEFPYLFDSSKFNNAFRFEPTSYHAGIRETAIWALEQNV
jgi:hypothetical protein